MTTTSTIFWTFSFIFAISGIIFGIIASYNASKANKKIQELIYSSLVNNQSQIFFFSNIKNIIAINKNAIAYLNNHNSHIYQEYSLIASPGRLAPISSKLKKILYETEYNEILKKYSEVKKFYDQDYKKIINDFTILQTNKKISASKKNELLNYHKSLIKKSSLIIKSYQTLISREKF